MMMVVWILAASLAAAFFAAAGSIARPNDQLRNAAATIGNILDYATRFELREMGVMLVSDMHRAIGEDIFAVPEFADWADKIADIMLY